MALSGLVLAGFVFFHMMGNLLFFKGPDAINAYAHWLKSLPKAVFWGFRLFLLVTVYVHARLAILLTLANRKARPLGYADAKPVRASWASAHMGLTGSLLGAFIVFHLLHFTVQCIFPEYRSQAFVTQLHGVAVHDVYGMMAHGFGIPWVSASYCVAMLALGLHLQHGCCSALQSLGLVQGRLRQMAKLLSYLYAWVVTLGFLSVPGSFLVRSLLSW
jgi:succinate dehydrogenase / fumarate reductase cytochrome b subunit